MDRAVELRLERRAAVADMQRPGAGAALRRAGGDRSGEKDQTGVQILTSFLYGLSAQPPPYLRLSPDREGLRGSGGSTREDANRSASPRACAS